MSDDQGQTADRYAARIVYHDDPRGPHLDLFVLVPGRDLLVCYELPVVNAPAVEPFLLVSGPEGVDFPIEARRKPDHRAVYWTYAGPVAGRGLVVERGSGFLVCDFFSDVLHLIYQ